MARRTLVGALFLLLLLVGALGGALLVRDVLALEPLLRGAETELTAAQTAVEDGDGGAATAALARAAERVAAARGRADGPLWSVVTFVPRYGASAEAVRGGVDLAGATTELAEAALGQALALADEGAAAFIGDGGRVDTTALVDAATALEDLPLEQLVEARDALAALPTSGLIGPTADARSAGVQRATRVIDQIDRARIGATAFSGFLGADERRTYLLAVQNPAELRGTGGLLSVLSELTVDGGAIDVRPAGGGELVDDRIARGGQETVGFELEPVDRSGEFAERYDSNAAGAIIQSVNLDPDLPTVAPVLLELYEARTGRTADGVVLVDPFALATIIGATGGPLDVEAAALAEAPSLPTQLTAQNTPRTLLIDVYDAFGGTNPARSAFDDAVTLATLERLRSGSWEPAVLARALGEAAAARRLQLWSADVEEQAGFRTLGLAGSMPDPESGDLLAVTGVNAGPDKSDAHVGHAMTATIALVARPGAAPSQVVRETSVTVEVTNPLRPGDHDDYVTGTNEPAPIGQGSPRVRDALNRTWFQVWSPATTELSTLRDGINDRVLRTGTIHGHRAIDYFLETPSASTAAFQAGFRGPLDLEQVDGRYLYELELWRQAKAIPDVWDLTVAPPAGLSIVDVEVVGGGPATTGLGPLEPAPVRVELTSDGTAHLTGGVTRDTVLRVWLD